MKKILTSLSALLSITCLQLYFASAALPLSNCVNPPPSAIGICDANGALFNVNIDANVTDFDLTLSITDANGSVFFPINPTGEFPACTSSVLSSTHSPFHLEIVTSPSIVTITPNPNSLNSFHFNWSGTPTPTIMQIRLRLDCSISNFIRTNNTNYLLTYKWEESGTTFCNGDISIQQTQIIDDNGTTYNTAISVGYKENKTLDSNISTMCLLTVPIYLLIGQCKVPTPAVHCLLI